MTFVSPWYNLRVWLGVSALATSYLPVIWWLVIRSGMTFAVDWVCPEPATRYLLVIWWQLFRPDMTFAVDWAHPELATKCLLLIWWLLFPLRLPFTIQWAVNIKNQEPAYCRTSNFVVVFRLGLLNWLDRVLLKSWEEFWMFADSWCSSFVMSWAVTESKRQ